MTLRSLGVSSLQDSTLFTFRQLRDEVSNHRLSCADVQATTGARNPEHVTFVPRKWKLRSGHERIIYMTNDKEKPNVKKRSKMPLWGF